MRVLFLNHSTAAVSLGGAERSLLALVEDWHARDPELEAIFATKAPRGKFIMALEERGWGYHALRFRGWALPAGVTSSDRALFAAADYSATLALIDLIERERPDLVVTNTLVAPWAAFAAATVGIPHAWFVREYGDLDHGLEFQGGREVVLHDIGVLSNAVFTVSAALKAHLGNYLDEEIVTVAYPRIDADAVGRRLALPPTSAPFPTTEPGLRIAVVGRLAESKGQWRVIEAMGLLKARGVSTSLALIGGEELPSYSQTLRARVSDLGLGDRVAFLGEQANPFPAVAEADVCVTASTMEAFGRSTLEYMIAGKPVVASSTGGSAELVDAGVSGFLFEPDDIDGLADRLAVYALDPSVAVAHGAAGAARSSLFLHANEATIDRLIQAASAPVRALPRSARYWFSLPALVSGAPGAELASRVSFIARRSARAVRHPIASARLLARRLRP